MNIYLISSALTSRPATSLASHSTSLSFYNVFTFNDTISTKNFTPDDGSIKFLLICT